VKISQQRFGLPLDENDLWIAATALALDATLVSRDSDFQAVEGLSVVEPNRITPP
jgi:tRNA(fMet)-specific endonuclease VapC